MYLRFFKRAEQITTSALEARTLLPFAFLLMLAFLVALAWDGFSRTRELSKFSGLCRAYPSGAP